MHSNRGYLARGAVAVTGLAMLSACNGSSTVSSPTSTPPPVVSTTSSAAASSAAVGAASQTSSQTASVSASAPAPAPVPSAGARASATTSGSGALVQARAVQSAYEAVVRDVLPSVVEITTSEGLGSGVVYDDKGDIVTNDHVVGTAKTFQVTFANGAKAVTATLVGTYPPDDLAVIKVSNTASLHPATFGDSGQLQVGAIVLAMGNPLGLASSVTNGIVSAVGRPVTEPQSSDSPGATLPDAIQTSAAINPGNSGGALVDLNEHVIGIPTLAATDQQLGGGAAPGIGFAIPSNVVTNVAQQLIATGSVTSSGRAALNVSVRSLMGPNGNASGVGIAQVQAGGAAAKAGLKVGDVITAVNGTATPTTEALSTVLASLKPGVSVTVSVTRSTGGTAKVTVLLGELGS